MFRTGHKNDPTPVEVPEPTRPEPAAVESVAAEQAVVPTTHKTPTPVAHREANIGRGVTFDGTLRFTGSLTIDGSFSGNILAGDTLVIGTGATVTADVTCGAIEVFGEVHGSLTGTRAVELRAAARVSADVTTPSLRIADGAVLDGTVKMRGTATRKRSDHPRRPGHVADPETPSDEPVPVG